MILKSKDQTSIWVIFSINKIKKCPLQVGSVTEELKNSMFVIFTWFPCSQRLLERTRQRREKLNEKLGKNPEPVPRKRLLEENTSQNINNHAENKDEGNCKLSWCSCIITNKHIWISLDTFENIYFDEMISKFFCEKVLCFDENFHL